jgi:hypothetical protein
MTLALRNRIAGVLAAALLAAAWSPVTTHALSFTIDSAGDSQTVNWNLDVPGGTLSAMGTFTASAVSATTVDVLVSITNTMSLGINQGVHAIGFNTNPAVSASLFDPGNTFTDVANDTNFPSFQTIEVCVFTSNNCSGGPQGGELMPGETDSFTLRLSGDFSNPPMLTLDTFAIRFKGDLGSWNFEGNGDNGGQVPAPAPLIVLGAGILGMWLIRRRF